jgi:hypothetical protein
MNITKLWVIASDSDTYSYNSSIIIKAVELLELYVAFIKTFSFDIVKEHNSNETENWYEEYLDMGGATEESINLFKKIKIKERELEEEM